MDFYHSKLISKCGLFTGESVGLAKASLVFQDEQTIPYLLQYFETISSGEQFRRMYVFDAVVFNHDRHYGNFGVLYDTENLEVLRIAPAFDHNRCLFPELEDGQLSKPAWYLGKCRPMLGRDFVLTAKNLLTDEIRADLEKLRNFSFSQHHKITATQERLDALGKIVRTQAEKILT